jgi:hypothetical protein
MQRVQHGLIRIVRGPTGGFLASLGIAALLGGVALATPAPPIATVTDHRPDVIVAAPLDSYPTSSGEVMSAPSPSAGVHTDADPTGRGPGIHAGRNGQGPSNGARSGVGRASGGLRSAGATPAHQDARDDPPATGHSRRYQHRHGDHGSGAGEGHQGSGSGGHHGDDGHHGGSGSGGSGPGSSGGAVGSGGSGGGSGSGGSGNGGSGTGSGDRGDGGDSGHGGAGSGGSDSSGSGHDGPGGDNNNGNDRFAR